jgi:hypothetical protein
MFSANRKYSEWKTVHKVVFVFVFSLFIAKRNHDVSHHCLPFR